VSKARFSHKSFSKISKDKVKGKSTTLKILWKWNVIIHMRNPNYFMLTVLIKIVTKIKKIVNKSTSEDHLQ